VTEPIEDPKVKEKHAETLRKWRIKAGKAMYVLCTAVEDELLEYIREASTPKIASDTLAILFSKKSDARHQLLEKELMTISQGSMTISQYFTKVKSLCSEIAQIDPGEKISEQRMRRILINGLKPEYNRFIATIQGWSTQPTLLELENMLANQEALAKQMARVSLKREEEALFSSRRMGRPDRKSRSKPEGRSSWQQKSKEKSNPSGGARYMRNNDRQPKERSGECYNYGKKGHYARDYWSKKNGQGNMATLRDHHDKKSREDGRSEDDWDVEVACAVATTEEEERYEKPKVALTVVNKSERINYESDWIIDYGCSNHMIGDIKKLDDLEKYKGR
jgi:gag-polypeptide of LTR copia-type